jgi:phage protein D
LISTLAKTIHYREENNPQATNQPGQKERACIKQKEGDYLAGAEGNVFVIRKTFKTEKAAKRAAAAKWRELQRGAATFSITLARGRADLYRNSPPASTVLSPRSTVELDDNAVRSRYWRGGFTTSLELEVKIDDWTAESDDSTS